MKTDQQWAEELYSLPRALTYDRAAFFAKFEMIVAEVRQQERELLDRQRWIAVSTRVPDEPGWYLVSDLEYVWNCFWGTVISGKTGEFDWSEMGERVNGITHWMPLPDPPEKKS